MHPLILGICIYILGFIISVFSTSFFDGGQIEFSYYYGIMFSILYLSAVVGISTALILKVLRNNRNQ